MKLTKTYEGIKMQGSSIQKVADDLTLECPLSIAINGEIFTLTMQTPGNEKELIRGLLFSEGVYKNREIDIVIVGTEINEEGYMTRVDLDISPDQLDQSQLNKRSLLSVASCGICGKTELSIPEGSISHTSVLLAPKDISSMFAGMASRQSAFISSGGCHASAAFSAEFAMLTLMEDIGRHNAVDKVIGDLILQKSLAKAKFLLVSGRVSYEIVVKCFTAGIPFLLAVSAPSSLAVDFAKELGITLICFCREDRATTYAHPERIIAQTI